MSVLCFFNLLEIFCASPFGKAEKTTSILFNKLEIMHYEKPLFYYRKHGKNLSREMKKILKTRLNILKHLLNKNFQFKSILLLHKKNTIKRLNR